MSKPITPEQAQVQKNTEIPDYVFDAVNTLIARKLSGKRAVIRQCDVIDEILKNADIERQTLFNNGWLDFEPAYRDAGWDVVYDKPGYCETYEANWKFTIDRK